MADILNKLNSANYVTVKVTDNAITNGNNLLAAYALAKTVTPNAIALSTSNRLAVILPAATYDLGTQSLILDTQYIDIVGSTSDRSKHYITSNLGAANRGTVQQTANDVKLYNLTIENSNTTYSPAYSSTDPAAYFPSTNLNLTYVENVLFTSNSTNVWSMRMVIEYSGTFIDCIGGINSFSGGLGTASGTFTNCTGGLESFGSYGTANGNFINCTGGIGSFGGSGGAASGTFKDCTGGDYSFGGEPGGSANGNFTNCTGGINSFGGTVNAGGTFTNCTGGIGSFGGSGGAASGTFKDCTGGIGSFGGNGGTASGTFTNCSGGDYSFGGAISSTAVLTNCTGGDYSFASGGAINGTLTNCTGGIGSFNL
jgi:hypothetical protein